MAESGKAKKRTKSDVKPDVRTLKNIGFSLVRLAAIFGLLLLTLFFALVDSAHGLQMMILKGLTA